MIDYIHTYFVKEKKPAFFLCSFYIWLHTLFTHSILKKSNYPQV